MKYVSLISALLALLAFRACKSDKHKATGDEEMAVDVAYPEVDSVTLHKEYPAYLQAEDIVNVVGRVNGQLMSQNYKDGDHVTKGQVLFTIESTTYRDAVTKAEAALASARAQYDYAKKEYAALKKALESDAVSRMEVVQAENNMKEAEANISTAQAALSTARTMLSYCTVRAPISGKITDPVFSVGNYISGEAQPTTLASIYKDDAVKVIFSVDDASYLEIVNNDVSPEVKRMFSRVPVTFGDTLPHTYTADLYYMSPQINKSTGTITFTGRIINQDGELKNGMFATVNLPYAFEQNAILVKDASVSTDQRGKYLYVVGDSDKIVYTPIEVGEVINDSMRVVTKGIGPKSRYVTKALLKVRDGMRVKPVMTK